MGPNDRDKALKAMDDYRTQHIQSIVDEVVSMEYAGIDLNYEGLRYEDRELQNAYIRDVAAALHSVNKEVIVTLAGKDTDQGTWEAPASQDYKEIGEHVDYVRVMCYGATQSLPLSQVRSWIEYTIALINRQKVMLANPFFDCGPAYTSQMCDLVLEYDLRGLCAWTLSYDQSEPGDFEVIRSKFQA
jgi:spore germination protein YaaH